MVPFGGPGGGGQWRKGCGARAPRRKGPLSVSPAAPLWPISAKFIQFTGNLLASFNEAFDMRKVVLVSAVC